MPIYKYKCKAEGLRSEGKQSAKNEPLDYCPECNDNDKVQRAVSGSTCIICTGTGQSHPRQDRNDYSLEVSGKTCCDRDARSGKSQFKGGL